MEITDIFFDSVLGQFIDRVPGLDIHPFITRQGFGWRIVTIQYNESSWDQNSVKWSVSNNYFWVSLGLVGLRSYFPFRIWSPVQLYLDKNQ